MSFFNRFIQLFLIFAITLLIHSFVTVNSLASTFQKNLYKIEIQNSTHTVRVFHDGFWWFQVYNDDSNSLLYEYIDEDQT